ncbi:hypothetical protein LMG22037_06682 [Paraburkholderia phenoliruptrix]|uniref:Uncharacterized protein n=1 Tax=Paraburkholderia phenoliruptrix TaxID=252970 RepID=A0A6J5CT99_9BURK|nr:hypothetical protein LMG22037_06682 [Paraburkholderia phenoliruptrix]
MPPGAFVALNVPPEVVMLPVAPNVETLLIELLFAFIGPVSGREPLSM